MALCLIGRSSVPFASPQTLKIFRGSFLRRSSLPFASPETVKVFRGSFDQALWPQAIVVRALKPAVCQPSSP